MKDQTKKGCKEGEHNYLTVISTNSREEGKHYIPLIYFKTVCCCSKCGDLLIDDLQRLLPK